jgi:hypothetical protein
MILDWTHLAKIPAGGPCKEGRERFQVFTAIMKNVFWDGAVRVYYNPSNTFIARFMSSTLKMEATNTSETSAYIKPTLRHIPEKDILQVISARVLLVRLGFS